MASTEESCAAERSKDDGVDDLPHLRQGASLDSDTAIRSNPVDTPPCWLHEAPSKALELVDLAVLPSMKNTSPEPIEAQEAFFSRDGLAMHHTLAEKGTPTHEALNVFTAAPLDILEPTDHTSFETFPSTIGYTPSAANGTSTLADMFSFAEFSSAPHFHATQADILAMTTVDLQQHWLSSDKSTSSTCAHHDLILQRQVSTEASDLGPIERYLAEGPWEQYAIVALSDREELSTTRHCPCLAMAELTIEHEEGLQQ